MKVKMLRNPAIALGCPLKEGETGEVNPTVGSKLVALGIAETLGEVAKAAKPKTVKAVPPAAPKPSRAKRK